MINKNQEFIRIYIRILIRINHTLLYKDTTKFAMLCTHQYMEYYIELIAKVRINQVTVNSHHNIRGLIHFSLIICPATKLYLCVWIPTERSLSSTGSISMFNKWDLPLTREWNELCWIIYRCMNDLGYIKFCLMWKYSIV